MILTVCVACAISKSRKSTVIRVVSDPVEMRRDSSAVSLRATVLIRNDGRRPLFFSRNACGAELQRSVDNGWQTVWMPACTLVIVPPLRIAPGDSVTTTFNAVAFTTNNAFPRYDPRMTAGRYRLLLPLGFKVDSRGIADRLDPDQRASDAFVVSETSSR